jgi:hypothetical protein
VDKKCLEFWGNFLTGVAQGQLHLKDLPRFFEGDVAENQTPTDIFLKAYGLENLNKQSPDFQKMWKKSWQEFQASHRAYLSLLGGVPREDFAKLERRYEEVQARAEAQEETIRQLRLLLGEKGLDYRAVTRSFQELIKKQTQTVQDFFSGLVDQQKKDT